MNLVTHPAPILNKVMPEFDFANPVLPAHDLEEQMVKTMYGENGIGLAAPQVGVEARVFVIMTRNIAEVTEPFAVFNPVILAASEETELEEEGCLSFPDLWLHVNRYKKIHANYQDMQGSVVETTLEGLVARVYQHELDHLDGVCFDTRVGPVSLDFAKNKRRKKLGKTFN